MANCLQCNEPINGKSGFCCMGCEAAYKITEKAAGKGSYYSNFARPNDDNSFTITLAVDGIHCVSCIRLIENALNTESSIVSARVNMTTNRLTFTFKGEPCEADRLANIVINLGYKLKPFELSEAEKDSAKQQKFLLMCIAIAGFASGNIMLISVGLWSTTEEVMGMATTELFHYVSAVIAIPAILFSARPFFRSAISILRDGHTNMDVPISLAIVLATAMSLFETVRHGEHIYFDSAIMLTFFLLIGRYLDERAKGKARESAQNLLSKMEGMATILTKDGRKDSVLIKNLKANMRVLVATGENIPADGVIAKGKSDIDMSLINGESIPVTAKEGSDVFTGTTNLSAPLEIIVAKASDKSLLSEIVKLMEKAEQGQAYYVRLADKAAKLYTPVVHSMGLLTFLGWWLVMQTPWQTSLMTAVTVLIITCPCALGLAVPVVQVLASGLLMKKGILLKSGDALEKLASIDTILFDKTGTLTLGKPELINENINSLSSVRRNGREVAKTQVSEKDLKLAASIAVHSKHPLSAAISKSYHGKLIKLTDVKEIPGKGLQAIYRGKTVRLGKRSWCGGKSNKYSNALELWLSIDGKDAVQFTFADTLRRDAQKVVTEARHHGLNTIMLSGDRKEAAERIAEQIGITTCLSELSPVEKCEYIEKLTKDNKKTLMVGDGLNDAPSLMSATISMSPSTAMDIAQNAADIVFSGDKLQPVLDAWYTATFSNKLVKQNFIFAVAYNVVAIPMAVTGNVTPMIAALAMSGSSLIVIMNSFRLNLRKG